MNPKLVANNQEIGFNIQYIFLCCALEIKCRFVVDISKTRVIFCHIKTRGVYFSTFCNSFQKNTNKLQRKQVNLTENQIVELVNIKFSIKNFGKKFFCMGKQQAKKFIGKKFFVWENSRKIYKFAKKMCIKNRKNVFLHSPKQVMSHVRQKFQFFHNFEK